MSQVPKKVPSKKATKAVKGGLPNPASFVRYGDLDWIMFSELIRQQITAFDKSTGEVAREIGWPPALVQLAMRGRPLRDVRVDQLIGYLSLSENDLPRLRSSAAKNHGNRIFISYSHKDQDYLERLMVHLKPLKKKGIIDPWIDTRLKIGDKWKSEIEAALKHASVGILLVSADFLASDFIVENELPPLLGAAEDKGTLIIPIIVKPCRFARDETLNIFQAANSPDEPLSALDESEREFLYDSIAQRIEDALPTAK